MSTLQAHAAQHPVMNPRTEKCDFDNITRRPAHHSAHTQMDPTCRRAWQRGCCRHHRSPARAGNTGKVCTPSLVGVLKLYVANAGHRVAHARLRAVAVVHIKVQQRHAPDACARHPCMQIQASLSLCSSRLNYPAGLPGADGPLGMAACSVIDSNQPCEAFANSNLGPVEWATHVVLRSAHIPCGLSAHLPCGLESSQEGQENCPKGRACPLPGTWTPRTPRRWPGCSAGRSPGCRAGRWRMSQCPPAPRGAPEAAPHRMHCAPGTQAGAQAQLVQGAVTMPPCSLNAVEKGAKQTYEDLQRTGTWQAACTASLMKRLLHA